MVKSNVAEWVQRLVELAIVKGILSELSTLSGKSFDASNFNSRLRIQKSIYLLQALGNRPVREYWFTNYFRGPYCPALAKDYYGISSKEISPAAITLGHHEMAIMKSLLAKGDLVLETVCTLHSVYRSRADMSKEEAFKTVRTLKPFLSEENCEDSWIFLRVAGLV